MRLTVTSNLLLYPIYHLCWKLRFSYCLSKNGYTHMLTLKSTNAHNDTHIFFHLTQLKHGDMSGNTCALGMWRNQESGDRTLQEKNRVGVREEGLNCKAIEEQFVKAVHMHTGLQSPSAHNMSLLLVTSTKTKRSWMLQMYYVGGIIKSNPSQSQLYLPKDTGQSCMHSWYVCLCMCVYILVCFCIYLQFPVHLFT